MKNNSILLILITAVSSLILIKVFLIGGKDNGKLAITSQNKDLPIGVVGFIAKIDTLEDDVFVSGTLTANELVELKPEISGRVVKIGFLEGSEVSSGSLLFKINDTDLQAQLKKLKLQETLATENLDRRKKLLAINGISKEEFDAVSNQLATIQADIIFTESQLSKSEIKAPFSGRIGLKNISEGSYINAGTTLATLVQINPIKIDFSVPEKYVSLIKTNGKIKFKVDGLDDDFSAIIKAFEPQIDQSSRTLKIRALTSNQTGKLIPGAFAEIKLPIKQNENTIMIPTQAIVPILKGQKVFISKNGLAEERKVETGVRSDSKIQILKGLEMGDTLIISGLLQVKPGSKLKFNSIK
jgi:membrane fusion protein (multidrug efflux system)